SNEHTISTLYPYTTLFRSERDGQIFRVYNVHLQSIGFDKEDYQYIKGDAPAGNVNVQSTRRIGQRLKWAYIKRNDQTDLLYQHRSEEHTSELQSREDLV